jgi:TonB family protein
MIEIKIFTKQCNPLKMQLLGPPTIIGTSLALMIGNLGRKRMKESAMKRIAFFTMILAMFVGIGAANATQPDYDKAVSAEKVYGNVEMPNLMNAEKPARMAVNNREIEGYITVEMLVNEEGTVEHAKVLYRSSMIAVRNAVDAVSRWQFAPAKVNGIPAKALVAYNVPMGPRLEIFQEKSYGTQLIVPDGGTMADSGLRTEKLDYLNSTASLEY